MKQHAVRIAAPLTTRSNGGWDPPYAAFFDHFNRGEFFEAHEALEVLWLTRRQHPDGDFYKALIQVAGAFVHVERRRPAPAASLLRSARRHLGGYPAHHQGISVEEVRELIAAWLDRLAPGGDTSESRAAP